MPATKIPFDFKISRTKRVNNIADKHVITLISLGKGISGIKNLASEEELHVQLLNQLGKYRPKKNIILVGGFLKRWNFWEMIPEVSDETLKEMLSDAPENTSAQELAVLLAKKFSPIALTIETNYIEALENYLAQHRSQIRVSFPYQIAGWQQRTNFENCSNIPYDTSEFTRIPESTELIEATRKRFIDHKKTELKVAEDRIKSAQPNLSHIDLNELTNHACLNYLLEEYEYFARLTKTEVFYNGKIPPAMNPIFEDENKQLHWRRYDFQPSKHIADEKKQSVKITRAKSTSCVDHITRKHSEMTLKTFAKKRYQLFSSLNIPSEKTEIKPVDEPDQSEHMINTRNLSPNSSKDVVKFLQLYTNNPPSPTKELVKQTISEIIARLTKS